MVLDLVPWVDFRYVQRGLGAKCCRKVAPNRDYNLGFGFLMQVLVRKPSCTGTVTTQIKEIRHGSSVSAGNDDP